MLGTKPAQIGVGVKVGTGTGEVIVTTKDEVAGKHGPEPSGSLVVKVKLMLPLVILGVYEVVSTPVFPKLPDGADHVAELADPPIEPAKFIV
jgi:hypothetical protein